MSNISGEAISAATETEKSEIAIYPNPVINKQVNLQFVNQEKGIYQLAIIDEIGHLVYSGNISINGDNQMKSIQLSKSIAGGIYQLKIVAASKKVTVKQVLIQ